MQRIFCVQGGKSVKTDLLRTRPRSKTAAHAHTAGGHLWMQGKHKTHANLVQFNIINKWILHAGQTVELH